MAFSTPTFEVKYPSSFSPYIIYDRSTRSAFRRMFKGDQNETPVLSENAQMYYVPRLRAQTQARATQSYYSDVANVDATLTLLQTPTALIHTRARYSFQDISGYSEFNIPLPKFAMEEMNQAAAVTADFLALNGADGASGMLKTPGVKKVQLPSLSVAQSGNGTTVPATYPQQLALLYQTIQEGIQDIIDNTRSYGVSGNGRAGDSAEEVEVIVLCPSNVLADLSASGIPWMNATAATGAYGNGFVIGSVISQLIANNALNNIKLYFGPDDQLAGSGANGANSVIITMPILPILGRSPLWNTDAVAEGMPRADNATNLQPFNTPSLIHNVFSNGIETDDTGWQRICGGNPSRPEATIIVEFPADMSSPLKAA